MNTLLKSNYLGHSALVGNASSAATRAHTPVDPHAHAERVLREMRELGATPLSLRRFGARYLPRIIHPDEHIEGLVYGRDKEGAVILVATDRRVIYLDKKPFFVSEDEVAYDVISGVNFGHAGLTSTVEIKTRIGDYKVHTFNHKCAENFVEYIESRCLEF